MRRARVVKADRKVTVTQITAHYNSVMQKSISEVRGLPVWSRPGRVEVSLSKTPNPDELVGTFRGSQPLLVCQCVCERVNEKHQLYSALDKGAI